MKVTNYPHLYSYEKSCPKIVKLPYTDSNTEFSNTSSEFYVRLVVRDRNGAIVLNKDVTEHWNKPLRLWNCSNELLIFLHIPKSGGTSLREALKTSLGNKTSFTCNLQHVNTEKVFISQKRKEDCLRMSPSDCASHFDWRTIQGLFVFSDIFQHK